MSEDATLDTFSGAEADAAEAAGERDEEPEEGAAESEDAGGDEETTNRPETPALTYTSSPDGDECGECGETVQNRWRAGEGAADPDALVCPDCKIW